jgi:hypothetical protein
VAASILIRKPIRPRSLASWNACSYRGLRRPGPPEPKLTRSSRICVGSGALWSWDESHDFSIWGDDYVNPPARNRFIIEVRRPDGTGSEPGEYQVAITFGPWPRNDAESKE